MSVQSRVNLAFVLAFVVAIAPAFFWGGRMEARVAAVEHDHASAVEGLRQEMKGLQQQMQDRFTLFERRIDEVMRDQWRPHP